MSFQNPDDDAIRSLLREARRIAVVGASPNPARPSHGVMHYLLQAGYEAIPVRPGGGEVLGVCVVIELEALKGREKLENQRLEALLTL